MRPHRLQGAGRHSSRAPFRWNSRWMVPRGVQCGPGPPPLRFFYHHGDSGPFERRSMPEWLRAWALASDRIPSYEALASDSLSPICKWDNNRSSLIGLLQSLNEIMHMQHLQQGQPQGATGQKRWTCLYLCLLDLRGLPCWPRRGTGSYPGLGSAKGLSLHGTCIPAIINLFCIQITH